MVKHTRPENGRCDWQQFTVTHTRRLGEGITARARAPRGYTREQGSQQGCGLQASEEKRVGCPLILGGGCDWLIWIMYWVGRVVNPIRLKTRWGQLGELAKWGAFPAGWGAYLERAGQLNS